MNLNLHRWSQSASQIWEKFAYQSALRNIFTPDIPGNKLISAQKSGPEFHQSLSASKLRNLAVTAHVLAKWLLWWSYITKTRIVCRAANILFPLPWRKIRRKTKQRVKNTEHITPRTEHRMHNTEYRAQNTECINIEHENTDHRPNNIENSYLTYNFMPENFQHKSKK